MIPPDFSNWLQYKPYEFNAKQKASLLTQALSQLTVWHASRCFEYNKILTTLGVNLKDINALEDIPFIPVRLFKEFELLSIDRENIFKIMTSSGTSGQQVSKIYLDRETASLQIKVLSQLMGCLLGSKRVPMLIIDSPDVIKDRLNFSARGAGILGFSMFGKDTTYALDNTMTLDHRAVNEFLDRHQGKPVFIFGFTFMIWQYFILPLQARKKSLPLDKAILLHGGGWKKLQDQAVSNSTFKRALHQVSGIKRVLNYYGMVEQTGSLYMECKAGYLHTPIYADILIRRPSDFSVAEMGEEGIIEVLSMIPLSYPGHALLTEDIGVLLGEDDCSCGQLGKYFQIHGRVESSEVRGCSDTHELHT